MEDMNVTKALLKAILELIEKRRTATVQSN